MPIHQNYIKYICTLTLFLFVIRSGKSQGTTCTTCCPLPEHPKNGKWLVLGSLTNSNPGQNIPSGTKVSVRCDGQYTLTGRSVISCENGTWDSEIGECLKLCPSIVATPSTVVTCTHKGKTVNDCKIAKNGTVATFKCAPYYENPDLNRNPFRVCVDGSWGKEVPSCTPICGVKPDPPSEKKRTYYPWNVIIFQDIEGKKIFHCAGTLINERVVLTNANCFTDDYGNKFPVNLRSLAAGKSSNIYDDPNDTEAQFSEIEEAFVAEGFKGVIRKYINNLAVVIAKTPFNMTERVQPACFDWTNKYKNVFKYPGIKGYTPGPLKSDSFPNLEEVFEIDIPILNATMCYVVLGFKLNHTNYEPYYSYEKLCANYINSNQSAMCLIDIGTGLVSKNQYNDKYYVTGILSFKPPISYENTTCDNQLWLIFTELSKFTDFIAEKNDLYTPIRRPYFQTSCGTKSVQAITLIINGKNVTKGDYPWQVALYQVTETSKELICGGSLINQRIILTAAHCVTDLEGNVLPKELYIAAVGKYFRNFNDSRDTLAQFSTIKDIFVPNVYRGDLQNFVGDIAILVTENFFVFSKDVEPVCVYWDVKYEKQVLRPSATGFIPGWGLTKENSDPSEVLKELEVTYIEREECKKKLPSDYDIYLTPDKICSGRFNESSSVCTGDSGGGLVFKNINDGKYYIAGIVSLSPQTPSGDCDSQSYALYTKVSEYITKFLLEKVRLYLT